MVLVFSTFFLCKNSKKNELLYNFLFLFFFSFFYSHTIHISWHVARLLEPISESLHASYHTGEFPFSDVLNIFFCFLFCVDHLTFACLALFPLNFFVVFFHSLYRTTRVVSCHLLQVVGVVSMSVRGYFVSLNVLWLATLSTFTALMSMYWKTFSDLFSLLIKNVVGVVGMSVSDYFQGW